MEWVRLILVLTLLGRAIYTDIKQDLIENRCIVTGLLAGMVYVAVDRGVSGVIESVKMAGIILGVLFFLFLIKGLGAGDIKLLCVLAMFYPKDIFRIVMAAFCAAAGMAVGKMVWRKVRKLPVYVKGETMNFSIPIGCGTLFVMFHQ